MTIDTKEIRSQAEFNAEHNNAPLGVTVPHTTTVINYDKLVELIGAYDAQADQLRDATKKVDDLTAKLKVAEEAMRLVRKSIVGMDDLDKEWGILDKALTAIRGEKEKIL